jgi:hypothetical protein
MQRILLLPALLAIAVLALGCSGGESTSQKTPEQIAELEADCIQNTPVGETEGLDAVSECLKRARE